MKACLLLIFIAFATCSHLTYLDGEVEFEAFSGTVAGKQLKGNLFDKKWFYAIPSAMKMNVKLDYPNKQLIININGIYDKGHFKLMQAEMKVCEASVWGKLLTYPNNYNTITMDFNKESYTELGLHKIYENQTNKSVVISAELPKGHRLDVTIDFFKDSVGKDGKKFNPNVDKLLEFIKLLKKN